MSGSSAPEDRRPCLNFTVKGGLRVYCWHPAGHDGEHAARTPWGAVSWADEKGSTNG